MPNRQIPICTALTEPEIRGFYDRLFESDEYDEDELFSAQELCLNRIKPRRERLLTKRSYEVQY